MMGSPQILRMSCYISRPKDSECIHIFTYIDISLIIYVGVCIKSMGQPGHCKFQTACPDHHHCMIWASAQDQRLVFSDDLTQIYIYIYLQYIVLMQICFLHWVGIPGKKERFDWEFDQGTLPTAIQRSSFVRPVCSEDHAPEATPYQ